MVSYVILNVLTIELFPISYRQYLLANLLLSFIIPLKKLCKNI